MRIKCTITKQQDILWCENKAHADALVNSPVLWSDTASIMGDKNNAWIRPGYEQAIGAM